VFTTPVGDKKLTANAQNHKSRGNFWRNIPRSVWCPLAKISGYVLLHKNRMGLFFLGKKLVQVKMTEKRKKSFKEDFGKMENLSPSI
jgi:hypothetical protein